MSSNLDHYPDHASFGLSSWMGPTFVFNSNYFTEGWMSYLWYLTPFDLLLNGTPKVSKFKACLSALSCKSQFTEFKSFLPAYEEMEPYLLDVSETMSDIPKDEVFLNAAQEINNVVRKSSQVVALLPDYSAVPLSRSFRSALLDISMQNTTDFVMSDFDIERVGLKTKMQQIGTDSVIGPLTLKIFEAIGWPISQNPTKVWLRRYEYADYVRDQLDYEF